MRRIGVRGLRLLLVSIAAALLVAACGDRGGGKGEGAEKGSGVPAAMGSGDAGKGAGSTLPYDRLAIPLPAVRVPTPGGDSIAVGGRQGDVTVINFWATWCVPCLEEIPDLVALQDSIDDEGGRVLGIALDSGSPRDVRIFAREHGMDYELGMADHGWARGHFDVFGLPVTLVVGRNDTIRHRLIGPHDVGQFLAATRPYLPGSPSAGGATSTGGDRTPATRPR